MSTELMQLIEKEIPEGRVSLQENYKNLESVAQYCQENYLQNPDKKKALEETKNFTTHSLASVAYQINNLATNFLKLLDLQQNQLAEMESNVNHLAETVQIHKEKVARREIGVLTTNKSTTRPQGVKNGIIFPEHGERPTKYQRKPIDYSALDDVGHGVKTQSTASSAPAQKSSRSSSVSSGTTPAPSQQPPTPPQQYQGGSIGRAAGQQIQQGPYRTPAPPVAPPSVPGHYASMQQEQLRYQQHQHQQQQQQQQRGSYAHGQQPTPIGMARPISQSSVGSNASQGIQMPGGRVSAFPQQQSIDNLPPPPSTPEHLRGSCFDFEASPPMPPPPEDQFVFHPTTSPNPPPPAQFDDDMEPPPQEEDPYAATGPDLMSNNWVPQEYLEKVIAIYDYGADKPDELSFSENSVIYVLKKNDDGWWEGTLNGQTGLFPGNYVEGCL